MNPLTGQESGNVKLGTFSVSQPLGLDAAVERLKVFFTTLVPREDEQRSMTFQIIDDSEKKDPSKAKTIAMDLYEFISTGNADCFDKLLEYNLDHRGVFWAINPQRDPRQRRNANTERVRVLALDLDGASPDKVQHFHMQPTMIVESSPEKYHCYWFVDDVPLEEFGRLQVAIAERFDGDPTIKDLARVLRVPYFYHCKKGREITQLIGCYPKNKYTYKEFLAEFPKPAPKPRMAASYTSKAVSSSQAENYAQVALKNEYNRVASCTTGSRNHQLNKSAFALGQLVATGLLEETEVRHALENAAAACGLGECEIQTAISSGLPAGKRKPREVPALQQRKPKVQIVVSWTVA
jgi:ribosomal protein L18